MQTIHIPRVVIAGTNSGVGKTTIVTGLLACLRAKGLNVQAYKIGPDYIDPGYHQLAAGKPTHNLDTWLVPEQEILPIFAETAEKNDVAVIEGVMGLYDGGRQGVSSTAAIAKLLQAPVILVISAQSMGESAAAVALGYKLYDRDVTLAGVIINRLGSLSHEQFVRDGFKKIDVPIIGCLYRNDKLSLPERHLGLTPALEYNAKEALAEMQSDIGEKVNIEQVMAIACKAPVLETASPERNAEPPKVRIGVAQDEVFSFYYPASLEVLHLSGAELIPFSPLHDREIPKVDGLLLGGGFPEMFLAQLSENQSMLTSIRRAHQQEMPIYAECGGFMYLCREIIDFSGRGYPMVNLIPAVCNMEKTLQMVGYVQAKVLTANLFCRQDDILKGHEFHFSKMTYDDEKTFPFAFEFEKMRSGAVYAGGFAAKNILASYLHLHFAGNKPSARRFIGKCLAFKTGRNRGKIDG